MHEMSLIALPPEISVAYATWALFAVTFLLVIVTALLVVDGWRKGKEQRERWALEDRRTESERQPSAVVEITTDSESQANMAFTCFNLGDTTFYIDKLIVTTVSGATHVSDIEPQIVMPGTSRTVPYNPCEILGFHSREQEFVEANVILVLQSATARTKTEPEWFYVGDPPRNSSRCQWYVGRVSDRQPGALVRKPKVLGFHESD